MTAPPPIRVATVDDVDALLACLAEAFAPYRDAYTPGAFADTVLDAATARARLDVMTILVAEQDGRVAGTIAWSVEANGDGHIRGMAVRDDQRGAGLATRLLERAETDLAGAGCTHITLDTTAVLQPAIRFYEKHGYARTGRVQDFFGMDLLELAKSV